MFNKISNEKISVLKKLVGYLLYIYCVNYSLWIENQYLQISVSAGHTFNKNKQSFKKIVISASPTKMHVFILSMHDFYLQVFFAFIPFASLG